MCDLKAESPPSPVTGEVVLRIFSPDSWGQQDVAVVLEIVEGAASKHDVCEDVTSKAVEHGTEPGGHRTPPRNLHRACDTEEEPSTAWKVWQGKHNVSGQVKVLECCLCTD